MLICENGGSGGLLFCRLLMTLRCLLYHACQVLIAYEKVIFAKKKKKGESSTEGIIAWEVQETVGLKRSNTQRVECLVVCFGLVSKHPQSRNIFTAH